MAHPLREAIAAKGPAGWEDLWQRSITPWDRGQANPHLVRLLELENPPVKLPARGAEGVKAVVAGCGTVSHRTVY